MKALDTNLPTALRRGAARVDQDGPWSVSVAETPYDTHSYSLYIKTPTHNLTLTRTAMELVELDLKLRQSHPTVKIPNLPISPEHLPPPPKRKSTFLNTLSRLTSPTSAKHQRRAANASAISNTTPPTAVPMSIPGLPPIPPTTPLTSPSRENDLFSDSLQTSNTSDNHTYLNGSISTAVTSSAASSSHLPTEITTTSHDTSISSTPAPPTPSATSTALASYLTTISNLPQVRTDRVWKRFVRVRTDDLESVRVERAIKRVRSDLAAHVGSTAPPPCSSSNREKENLALKTAGMMVVPEEKTHRGGLQPDETGYDHHVAMEDIKKTEDEMQVDDGEPGHPTKNANATESTLTQESIGPIASSTSSLITDDDDNMMGGVVPATPLADTLNRVGIPRSQSAEPDKSHRISRSFTSSVPSQSGAESQTGEEGESSSSALVAALNGSARRRTPKGRKSRRRSHSRTTTPGSTSGGGAGGSSKETSLILKKSQRKVCIDDFEMMRVLGKGCAGKVLLVRHRPTADLFALKAITKRHVLAHQELQHTLTEQAVLKRMAAENRDPFVVKLWWSFHDKDNLFLVMDFHPGGDLATQLARWGRLGRDRARFYAAEIVEGVEGLHSAGVIYRDLKPENILIGGDGHIVLTDFGLSKEFPRHHHGNRTNTPVPASGSIMGMGSNSSSTSSVYYSATGGAGGADGGGGGGGHGHGHGHGFYSSVPGIPQPVTPPWMKTDRNGDMALGWPGQPIGQMDETTTFCGTAEYLAPEVIQGLKYSYEVDWWSFGTMLYEMLTGITPFWADNHADMYVRVLQDELQFPDDRAIDQDTKSLIRGLLQRVPSLRICEPRIKKHPYFSMIDWSHVYYKRYIPPYIPPIDPSNASDTQNFDDTFLDMEPVLDEYNDEAMDTDQEPQTDAERTDGEDSATTPSQSRSSSIRPVQPNIKPLVMEEDGVDVFDGYSFKGRHSVLMDEEDEDGSEEGSEEEGSGEEEEGEEEGMEGEEIDGDGLSKKSDVRPLGSLFQEDGLQVEEDEGLGPKTPEARPLAVLPPVLEPVGVETEATTTRTSLESEEVTVENAHVRTKETEEEMRQKAKVVVSSPVPQAETTVVVPPPVPPKPPSRQPIVINGRSGRPRKERSGVPALDRYIDEDTEVTEAERDEDDDWDLIEAVDGEDRNGAKGTSLFARGVVDRYRLKVFGKTSTPSRSGGQQQQQQQRVASGMSQDSPSPSQRRGRTPLTFRKHPREFLRAKSPRGKKNNNEKSRTASNSNTVSASSSIAGILTATPSQSSNTFGTTASPSTSYTNNNYKNHTPPSLKSKQSALSVGGQSQSSDQSNGQSAVFVEVSDAIQSSPQGVVGKAPRKMKLKKYKNNAEKVLSLFSSPRQNQP